MKKIIFSFVLLVCSLSGQAATCANGQGNEVVGINGTKYCMSPIQMNWWSAMAWCDAAGLKTIDPNTECSCDGFEGCDTTLRCPNFNTNQHNYVWTKVTSGSSSTKNGGAYIIRLNGNLGSQTKNLHYDVNAICRQ